MYALSFARSRRPPDRSARAHDRLMLSRERERETRAERCRVARGMMLYRRHYRAKLVLKQADAVIIIKGSGELSAKCILVSVTDDLFNGENRNVCLVQPHIRRRIAARRAGQIVVASIHYERH